MLLSTEELAVLAVDTLVDAGIMGVSDRGTAVEIVTKKIYDIESIDATEIVKPFYFELMWFNSDDDMLAGEEVLGRVTEAEVRQWFYVSDGEPAIGSYIVRASQRGVLQEHAKHKIDLNKYDYFVEAVAYQ